MINSLIRLLFLNWIYNTTVETLTRTHFSVVAVLPHPSIVFSKMFLNAFRCFSSSGRETKIVIQSKSVACCLFFCLRLLFVFFIYLWPSCVYTFVNFQFLIEIRRKKKIKINGIFSFEKYKKGANRKKVFLSPTRKCNPRYGDTWDNTHGKKKTSLEAEAEMCVFLLITHQEIYIYKKKEEKNLKKKKKSNFM